MKVNIEIEVDDRPWMRSTLVNLTLLKLMGELSFRDGSFKSGKEWNFEFPRSDFFEGMEGEGSKTKVIATYSDES